MSLSTIPTARHEWHERAADTQATSSDKVDILKASTATPLFLVYSSPRSLPNARPDSIGFTTPFGPERTYQTSPVEAVIAWAETMPVGFIWYHHLPDHLGIIYLFVSPHFRRQGLATRMLDALRAWHPGRTIFTDVGNELSTGWLQSCGFNQESQGWVKR